MGMPGGLELVAIIAVIVLLFGGKKIPELAKGLGKGIKEFKGAIKEDPEDVKEVTSKTADEVETKIEEKKSENA